MECGLLDLIWTFMEKSSGKGPGGINPNTKGSWTVNHLQQTQILSAKQITSTALYDSAPASLKIVTGVAIFSLRKHFPVFTFHSDSGNWSYPDKLYQQIEVTMAGVMEKFFVASMLMWIVPVAILYGFNHNLFPGSAEMSSHSLTLLSGFLAVISVNVVIAFYICMAMKEPSDKHEPDPKFLAEAKASVKHPLANEIQEASSSSTSKKDE